MSRSNNTTRYCYPQGQSSWPVYSDPDDCDYADEKDHVCIHPKEVPGRRTWKRKPNPHGRWAFLYTVPSWFRRDVNKTVRRRLNRELRAGKEMEDWEKWGSGLIQYYW